jgi:hypothetical protein
MPVKTYKITDTTTGKVKEIPWDKDREPTDDELEVLMNAPEPSMLKSLWNKTWEPLVDYGARAGKAIGEPLLKYSESGPDSLSRKAARYGGAFAETLGEGLDTLSSPGNIALTVASGGSNLVAKQAARAIPAVEDASRALYAARMAGKTGEAERLAKELNAARVSLGKASAVGKTANAITKTAGATQAGIAAEEGIRKKDIKQGIPFILGALGARGGHNFDIPPNIDIPASAGKIHEPTGMPQIYDSPIGPNPQSTFEGLSKTPEISKVNWDKEQQQGLDLEFENKQQQLPLQVNTRSAGMVNGKPAETAFDALVPERYKMKGEDIGLEGERPNIQPTQPELFDPVKGPFIDQTITPSQLEPRTLDMNRPQWSRYAEQKQLPFDIDTLTTAETSPIPEVQQAVKQLVQNTTFNNSTTPVGSIPKKGTFGEVGKDWFQSNYDRLVKDSPAGADIAKMIDKYRTESGFLSGQASSKIKDVTDPLSKEQYAEFQQSLDTGNASHDPMVMNAVNVVTNIDKTFVNRAIASGMHLNNAKGEMVPFIGRENYWPRIYDPSLFADKPALIERLIKQGMSMEDATKAVNNARRFGERLIDPQHQRVMDLPEHRKDIGALLKHYDDMSYRISAAENFGVKDIADPNTPISQLAAQTKDPGTTSKILTQYLDRDAGVQPHEADFAKKVSKVTTALYLSRFAISNTNQLAFVPVVTNLKSTAKALGQFITSPKKTWRQAESMGALQTVMQEAMRDMGGESTLSKVYGIKASEGSNRAISAIAGSHYVQDLYKTALKGNVRAQKSLENLTLENWDTLKAQGALTPKNIAYGATRVVEKTQGRAQSIDLPYNWDKSPYYNILLLYKKYAFVQNRLIKDALKLDPSQPLGLNNIDPKKGALLLGLFQLAGEATGDAKAGIKGLVTGDPSGEIEKRGEHMPFDNKMINRMLQNYTDSMFLGLIGDAVNASNSGKQGLLEFMGGPVPSLLAETGGNVIADAKNAKKFYSQGRSIKKSATLRGMASHVPVIGGGLNASLRNTDIH